MAFDIVGARKSGVPDSVIADHLANQRGFDIAGARKSGVPDSAVIDWMQNNPQDSSTAIERNVAPIVNAVAKLGQSSIGLMDLGTKGLDVAADYLSDGKVRIPTVTEGIKRTTGFDINEQIQKSEEAKNALIGAKRRKQSENVSNAFGESLLSGVASLKDNPDYVLTALEEQIPNLLTMPLALRNSVAKIFTAAGGGAAGAAAVKAALPTIAKKSAVLEGAMTAGSAAGEKSSDGLNNTETASALGQGAATTIGSLVANKLGAKYLGSGDLESKLATKGLSDIIESGEGIVNRSIAAGREALKSGAENALEEGLQNPLEQIPKSIEDGDTFGQYLDKAGRQAVEGAVVGGLSGGAAAGGASLLSNGSPKNRMSNDEPIDGNNNNNTNIDMTDLAMQEDDLRDNLVRVNPENNVKPEIEASNQSHMEQDVVDPVRADEDAKVISKIELNADIDNAKKKLKLLNLAANAEEKIYSKKYAEGFASDEEKRAYVDRLLSAKLAVNEAQKNLDDLIKPASTEQVKSSPIVADAEEDSDLASVRSNAQLEQEKRVIQDGDEAGQFSITESAKSEPVRASAQEGANAGGSGGDRSGGGETFNLESYTNEEIAQREDAAKAAAEAEAKAARDAENKASADAEVGQFTLTGSDRQADVAASAGQNDLFGVGSTRKSAEADSSQQFNPLKDDAGVEKTSNDKIADTLKKAKAAGVKDIKKLKKTIEKYGEGLTEFDRVPEQYSGSKTPAKTSTVSPSSSPEEGQVSQRKTLEPGDVFVTLSGRHTTPFPKYSLKPSAGQLTKDNKNILAWLKENAIAEAQARNDKFNLLQFEGLNINNWSTADGYSVNLYMFGDEYGELAPFRVDETRPSSSKENAKRDANANDTRQNAKQEPKNATNKIEDFGEKLAGTRAIADRMLLAHSKFSDVLQEIAGITKEQAVAVKNAYLKNKMATMNAVSGEIKVKNGAYLDKQAILNAVNNLDKALAALPFEQFHDWSVKDGRKSEGMNRKAWEALREEYGIEDVASSKAETDTDTKKETAKQAQPSTESSSNNSPVTNKIEDFVRNQDRYPYLMPSEEAPVVEAFDNLFDTIQTKEGDDGNVALFSRNAEKNGDISDQVADDIITLYKELGSDESVFQYDKAVMDTIDDTVFSVLPDGSKQEADDLTLEMAKEEAKDRGQPEVVDVRKYVIPTEETVTGRDNKPILDRDGNPQMQNMKRGAYVYTNVLGEMWVDLSELKKAGGIGGKIYSKVADFAHENGLVFIGDPLGLSDDAMVKRTEHMASGIARRKGTSQFAPHPRQVSPYVKDAKDSAELARIVRPLKWIKGNDRFNQREIIKTAYHNITKIIPELRHAWIDINDGRIYQAGSPIDTPFDDWVRDLQEGKFSKDGQRREDSAGGLAGQRAPLDTFRHLFASASIKRQLLANTLARHAGESAEKRRQVLDRLGAILPDLESLDDRKVFYQRSSDNGYKRGLSDGKEQTFASGLPRNLPVAETTASRTLESKLNGWRERQGLSGRVRVREVSAVSLPKQLNRALAGFTDATGTRVVLFRNLTPEVDDFNGVNFRDGVLYINENSQSPITLTAAHEWVHNLKKTNPSAYQELENEVRRQGRLDAWHERNIKEEGFDRGRDHAIEELTTAAVSDALTDPVFLQKLAERDQSAFRRIAKAFLEFLKTLTTSWKDQGSNAYLQDVEAFRDKLVQVLDELPVAKQRPGVIKALFLRVFHGTPHRGIEQEGFKLNKIGTGEGAQAYGWGVYFASMREVAEGYRKALSGASRGWNYSKEAKALGVDNFEDFRREFHSHAMSEAPAAIAARRIHHASIKSRAVNGGALSKLIERFREVAQGQLYSLDLPIEESDLLDYDKPLREQSQKVQKAIAKIDSQHEINDATKGEDIYFRLALDSSRGFEHSGYKGASEYLQSLGIPGLRYLDGVSRNRPLKDIKREFLAELPEDASADEVEGLLGTGRFSPKNEALVRALAADEWLGFDHPAQAISAALGKDLSNFDASPALRQAVADAQEDGTHNYVIWDESLLTPEAAQIQPMFSREQSTKAPHEKQRASGKLDNVKEAIVRTKLAAKTKATLNKWVKKERGLTESDYAAYREGQGELHTINGILVPRLTSKMKKAWKAEYGTDNIMQDVRKAYELKKYLDGDKNAKLPDSIKHVADMMRAEIDLKSAQIVDIISDDIRHLASVMDVDALDAANSFLNLSKSVSNSSMSREDSNKILSEAAKKAINSVDGSAQKSFVSDFIAKSQQVDSILANKGKYMNRSYQAHNDPDWMSKIIDDRYSNAGDDYKKNIVNQKVYDLAAKDILKGNPQATDKEIYTAIRQILQDASDVSNPMAAFGSSALIKKMGIFKGRKLDDMAGIRMLLGEYNNPVFAFANTMAKQTNIIASHKFLKGVRDNGLESGLFSTKQEGNYQREITGNGMSPLSGLYTTEKYYNTINDVLHKDKPESYISALLHVSALIKAGKTVLSPGTSILNFLSNASNAMSLGHWSPKAVAKTAKFFVDYSRGDKDAEALMDEAGRLGVISGSLFSHEVAKYIKEHHDVLANEKENIKRFMKPARMYVDAMTWFYEFGDNAWKINAYFNEIENGVGKTKAADIVANGYPNYSTVPKTVDMLKTVPFISDFPSFVWEQYRVSAHQLKWIADEYKDGNKAKALSAATRFIIARGLLPAAAYAISSANGWDYDEGEEYQQRMMAPWDKNGAFIFMPKDGKGNVSAFNIGRYSMYDTQVKVIKAIVAGEPVQAVKEALSGLASFEMWVDALYAAATGKTSSGALIYSDSDTAGDKVKKGSEFLWTQLAPTVLSKNARDFTQSNADLINHTLEGTPLASMGVSGNAKGKNYSNKASALQLIGVRNQNMNASSSLKNKIIQNSITLRANQKTVRDLLGSQSYINNAQVADVVLDYLKQYDRANNRISEDARYLISSGVAEKNVVFEALKSANVSKENAARIVTGSPVRWKPSKDMVEYIKDQIFNSDLPADKKREYLSQRIKVMNQTINNHYAGKSK